MNVDKLYELDSDKSIYAGNGNCIEKNISALRARKATIFWHPSWLITPKSLPHIIKWHRALRSAGAKLIVCCNDPSELGWCKVGFLHCILMNQNLHEYTIQSQEKKYDAIYIAQARPFKRMELAKEVEKLYILTYGCGQFTNAEGDNDLETFEPTISHARWNKGFIHDRTEVSSIICSSCAGLALSKREGAMWASVQYLLCGIPIVTTPSRGGREHFFDERHTYRTAPDSKKVKLAVDALIKDEIDPFEVRETVISKMKLERIRYVKLLNEEARFRNDLTTQECCDFIWGPPNGIKKYEATFLIEGLD